MSILIKIKKKIKGINILLIPIPLTVKQEIKRT